MRWAAKTLTDEKRSELDSLTVEYRDVESKVRAAMVAEDVPAETPAATSETREAGEVLGRANISGIFDAALTGKLPAGAERELQEQAGLDGNAVPLALLRRHEDGDGLERRTTGVTPVPASGSIGATQSEIIPAVFPEAASAFLGIPQPTVPVGERVYTVLSTSASPGTFPPRARIKATARRLSPHPS